jgi:hypothetical protein
LRRFGRRSRDGTTATFGRITRRPATRRSIAGRPSDHRTTTCGLTCRLATNGRPAHRRAANHRGSAHWHSTNGRRPDNRGFTEVAAATDDTLLNVGTT